MMVREYLQCLILSLIFEHPKARSLRFIGGTALRIVYGNHRFSEDIDFDFVGMPLEDFEEVLGYVEGELTNQGVETESKLVARGAWHFHLRFPSMLYSYGLSPYKEEKILIQVDAEAQGFTYEPETYLLNRFGLFSELLHAPAPVLMAMKFNALFLRKRSKGRDITDLLYLLGKGVSPDYSVLEKSLGLRNAEDVVKRVEGFPLDLEDLFRDVQPFLLLPQQEKKRFMHFRQLLRQDLT